MISFSCHRPNCIVVLVSPDSSRTLPRRLDFSQTPLKGLGFPRMLVTGLNLIRPLLSRLARLRLNDSEQNYCTVPSANKIAGCGCRTIGSAKLRVPDYRGPTIYCDKTWPTLRAAVYLVFVLLAIRLEPQWSPCLLPCLFYMDKKLIKLRPVHKDLCDVSGVTGYFGCARGRLQSRFMRKSLEHCSQVMALRKKEKPALNQPLLSKHAGVAHHYV
ncbi:hypothetical protein J6590_081470 [Homalodisca vitripennis]|nr:hypothetical protein J6590_081470 [Homalodisca vitripennis]